MVFGFCYFQLGSLLGILVLRVIYLGLYIFAIVLLSFIRKLFLEGFCLYHSLAIYHMWGGFHVESAKRQLIAMRYAVKYAINGSIYIAIILLDIVIENETPWYCKICISWAMPFCNLADHQLEVLMLGKLITFPKLILSNN